MCFLLIRILFYYLHDSESGSNVRHYNIDVKLNHKGLVRLKVDSLGNMEGGEKLLFLDQGLDRKKETDISYQEKNPESDFKYPLDIPDYTQHSFCNGKRWHQTEKAQNKYHIAGYTELMESEGCDSVACAINKDRTPIKLDFSKPPCNINDCLTVTIKTRFRYENTIKFITSIHAFYPKLRVIVMDEEESEKYMYGNKTEKIAWDVFLQTNEDLVKHVETKPGVGRGRTEGAKLANTKYILVVDDDYQFTTLTNISRLLEVIEMSDASIVGGDTMDAFPYAGSMRVARNTSDSPSVDLALYPNVFYEMVQCFRNCYVADVVKTFFIADRKAILNQGAWDVERLFYEHEDFFINVRRAGLKVVNCKDVLIKHVPKDQFLAAYRRDSHDIWQKHLFRKWKFSDLYICKKETYDDRHFACVEKRHFY